MRTETFITEIMQRAKEQGNFEELRRQIPLGIDMGGEIITAQKRTGAVALRHTCFTGNRRVECICNLLIMLSCFYEKDEVNFIILSPRKKYAELLGLKNMDVIVPYVRTKEELQALKVGLRDLVNMYSRGGGYPHLFLVLDGLEELPNCNDEELREYTNLTEWLVRRPNIELITGVDLRKSIFSGCPGAFVGIGNCLVTTREDGKADVTYVGEGTDLSLPVLVDFPCEPSVQESVQFFNGLVYMESGVADATIAPMQTPVAMETPATIAPEKTILPETPAPLEAPSPAPIVEEAKKEGKTKEFTDYLNFFAIDTTQDEEPETKLQDEPKADDGADDMSDY